MQTECIDHHHHHLRRNEHQRLEIPFAATFTDKTTENARKVYLFAFLVFHLITLFATAAVEIVLSSSCHLQALREEEECLGQH